MNFVPTRAAFFAEIGDHPGLHEEMQSFVTDFGALVAELYAWLVRSL